jgi:hypothetical protein
MTPYTSPKAYISNEKSKKSIFNTDILLIQENNNPFGIGDVVIAKYTPGQGRPYWPGKVLSVTGIFMM